MTSRCNGRCTGGKASKCEHDLNEGFIPCASWDTWYHQQSTNMMLARRQREFYRILCGREKNAIEEKEDIEERAYQENIKTTQAEMDPFEEEKDQVKQ
jgi:hypothetical protein